MNPENFQPYYGKTPAQLEDGERSRLKDYFELLGQAEHPVASLLVPVYRARETLLAHIVSLSRLKTLIPYEVLFIDNNADPESLAILEDLGAQVVRETRQGITHARQKGLESARGMVVCSLDPDTLYDPYYIDAMVLPFFEDPGLAVCYSVSKSYSGAFRLTAKGTIRNRIKVGYFRWKLSGGFENRIKYIRAVALAVRRELLLPIGYNTDLKTASGCDDGMLAMYLYGKGRFRYVAIDVYTATPPAREPGRPYPFCNQPAAS